MLTDALCVHSMEVSFIEYRQVSERAAKSPSCLLSQKKQFIRALLTYKRISTDDGPEKQLWEGLSEARVGCVCVRTHSNNCEIYRRVKN